MCAFVLFAIHTHYKNVLIHRFMYLSVVERTLSFVFFFFWSMKKTKNNRFSFNKYEIQWFKCLFISAKIGCRRIYYYRVVVVFFLIKVLYLRYKNISDAIERTRMLRYDQKSFIMFVLFVSFSSSSSSSQFFFLCLLLLLLLFIMHHSNLVELMTCIQNDFVMLVNVLGESHTHKTTQNYSKLNKTKNKETKEQQNTYTSIDIKKTEKNKKR